MGLFGIIACTLLALFVAAMLRGAVIVWRERLFGLRVPRQKAIALVGDIAMGYANARVVVERATGKPSPWRVIVSKVFDKNIIGGVLCTVEFESEPDEHLVSSLAALSI